MQAWPPILITPNRHPLCCACAGDERVDYTHVVRSHHIGDQLEVTLLRDGQQLVISYPLGRLQPLCPLLHGHDCSPEYMVGGWG